MNSSQMALIAGALSVVVSALILTSAQMRVLRRPEPRRTAYLVAWVVCVLFLAAFRTLGDSMVGNASMGGVLLHLGLWAAITAFALFVGDRVLRAARRAGGSGAPRFLTLFALHVLVVALVVYV